MISIRSKSLGIAVGEQSMLIAEVHISGDNRQVVRTGEFVYPTGMNLQQPRPLGTALLHFLKQNHFSTQRAVIGVPARWIIAREKEIPPTSAAMAEDLLRLAAEREFPSDLKEMVFDYAGQPSAKSGQKVLLAAMPRQFMDQVTQMADAARLAVIAITASSLALAHAVGNSQEDRLQLLQQGNSAELVSSGRAFPQMLRYLSTASLGNELHRLLAAIPGIDRIHLWSEMDEKDVTLLGRQLGIRLQRVPDLSVIAVRSEKIAVKFGPAVSLALYAPRRTSLPVDFLHARLAPPRAQRWGKKARWAAVALAAVVVGLGWLAMDLHLGQRRLDDLRAQLNGLKPELDAAEAVINSFKDARGWYEDDRPPLLGCLKDLTQAFPTNGSLWAVSFSIRDNCKGVLNGKATSQRSVLDLVDRIKNNKNFTEVKLMDMGATSGSNGEVTFALSFTFTGKE